MRYLALSLAILASTSVFALKGDVTLNTPYDWRLNSWCLIEHQKTWKELSKDTKVVVSVIDTGTSLHKKFTSNALPGHSFASKDLSPVDIHGHGTHVSGIILGVSDYRATILPLKYYLEDNTADQNLKASIKAIEFAIESGAKIINYSGGGPVMDETEYLVFKKAEAKGILVVVAAGNNGSNLDGFFSSFYPASYKLSNMISVASIDSKDNLLPTSNWGAKTIDLSAPGEGVYSMLPGERFGVMTGTSQATAIVSGIAAMMLSENPKLTAKEIKQIIESSVDKVPAHLGKTRTAGRVNSYAAVRAAKMFTKKSQ